MSSKRSKTKRSYRASSKCQRTEALALLELTAARLDTVRQLSPSDLMHHCLCLLSDLSGPSCVTNLSRALLCHTCQAAAVQASPALPYKQRLTSATGVAWDQVCRLLRAGARLGKLHAAGVSLSAALEGRSRDLSSLASLDWKQPVPAVSGASGARGQVEPCRTESASGIEETGTEPPLLKSVLSELKSIHALLASLV